MSLTSREEIQGLRMSLARCSLESFLKRLSRNVLTQYGWDEGCRIDAFNDCNLIQCVKRVTLDRIEQLNGMRFLTESVLFRALRTPTLFAA